MIFLRIWLKKVFCSKMGNNNLIGLCQLKEAKEPVKADQKTFKNKNVKISDLMRGIER